MDIVAQVRAAGGVARGCDLPATRRALSALVAQGALHRPRLGWYSTLSPSHPRYRAVRIGGRLTGASALHEMGAWMLDPPPRVEVAVPRGSSRLRPDAGAVVHWVENRADPAQPSLVGLQEALVRVILDHDLEVSVPCIDWALATGRLERVPYERLILALPQEARCITDWVDGRAQSVLESVARVRLLRRGWRTRSQVPVGEIEAIDLVIEDHVALELDGREFHQDRFERDRLKDLRIAIEGRHSIRVSYRMLRNNWPDVERAVGVALRRRGVRGSGSAPREPRGRRHATGAGRLDG